MIFLTATTESLTLVTAAALSLDWSTGYVDIDTTTGATPGSDQGNVATATTTTVVAAPGASVQRQLKSFTAVNKDASSTQTVTLNKVTGAGTFALVRNVTLAPNEALVWVDSIGFAVLDSVGVRKVANTLVNLSTGVTGTLPAQYGGTGQSSYTVGDLLYASGATALSKLAGVAAGNVLLSGGVATAPAWGKVDLTAHVTGVLPVANGGTGITSLGTGVATWLGTPSSANLRSAVTDETGTGALVFADTPTLVTPVLGAATGTSVVLSSTATASAFIPTGSSIPANGMYLAAANTLTLATASTERMQVNSVGNVGIGVSPFGGNNRLSVKVGTNQLFTVGDDASQTTLTAHTDAGSSTALRVSGLPLTLSGSGGAGAEHMRIDSSGNVGIGGAASNKLTVFTAGSADALRIVGADSFVTFYNTANTTRAGYIAAGAAGVDITAEAGASNIIRLITAAAERVRVDASGNVGIGLTPSGTYKLEVNGALSVNSTTMIRTGTAFTNGAAAATGTLTNAPAAGNPTKWVPINDAGTTRYIPAW